MPEADQVAVMAKLFRTDTAMTVTTRHQPPATSAVQVLGAIGCTSHYPAERYMRTAEVLQIFEGTNQIQRLVISRTLQRDHAEQ
jgi:alkylation response protein AidB-like acyl-CoA dehydrogenase